MFPLSVFIVLVLLLGLRSWSAVNSVSRGWSLPLLAGWIAEGVLYRQTVLEAGVRQEARIAAPGSAEAETRCSATALG